MIHVIVERCRQIVSSCDTKPDMTTGYVNSGAYIIELQPFNDLIV
jgi:hypothetical protein